MTLLTETFTALTTSESLSSVSDASVYHLARGNVAWALLAGDVTLNQ